MDMRMLVYAYYHLAGLILLTHLPVSGTSKETLATSGDMSDTQVSEDR